MVFSSQIFLFYFLPLVLALYYVLPFRARTALIAISSYVFYGWANPIWAVIMFFGSQRRLRLRPRAAAAVGPAGRRTACRRSSGPRCRARAR